MYTLTKHDSTTHATAAAWRTSFLGAACDGERPDRSARAQLH